MQYRIKASVRAGERCNRLPFARRVRLCIAKKECRLRVDRGVIQRNAWSLCVAVFTVLTATTAWAADDYPAKPGRLILPSGAGASADIMGRIFSQRFSEAWGQPLVVDNRAGAAGIIATELAAKAAPDGYTIFNYGIGQSTAPALHKRLPYHHLRDFTLISTYAMTPNLLTVTPSLGIANVQEFISAAKGQPGQMNNPAASCGVSTPTTTANVCAPRGGE